MARSTDKWSTRSFGSIQSLLEYNTMNVKRHHHVFIELWFNSMHIALRRNYGFLHSFYDFSKSNAFSKNLIRLKFIFHKIFFRMSILSSSKISWIFSVYISKSILLELIIIITVTIQVAVSNQFSWNPHGYYKSTHGWILLFWETIGPIEPLIWGKCAPKMVFWLSFNRYGDF